MKRTGKFDKIYISPDINKTLEVRNERRHLVDRLKKIGAKVPGKEIVEESSTTENLFSNFSTHDLSCPDHIDSFETPRIKLKNYRSKISNREKNIMHYTAGS